MKKPYFTPAIDIIIYIPSQQLLAGSVDSINPTGNNLPPITPGDGDGGGDPGSFTNKGLWEEE